MKGNLAMCRRIMIWLYIMYILLKLFTFGTCFMSSWILWKVPYNVQTNYNYFYLKWNSLINSKAFFFCYLFHPFFKYMSTLSFIWCYKSLKPNTLMTTLLVRETCFIAWTLKSTCCMSTSFWYRGRRYDGSILLYE